jgi:thiosulfate/3-mercaptopyruvate sulfurtransferase
LSNDIPAVISTDWLAAHLEEPGIKIIASESETVAAAASSQATEKRNVREEFEAVHIPDAVLFNLDEISDPDTDLLLMLPSKDQFSAHVGTLGISNDDLVVVYDSQGVRTSPRAWWMFRVFGHDKVMVLDGGLPKWRRENRPTATGPMVSDARTFNAELRAGLLLDAQGMMQVQANRSVQVVDARPVNRYWGTAAEPRGNIPSGHMPWSKSVPSDLVVNPRSGELLPLSVIRTNFQTAGVDIKEPAATTCGWGVAACRLALGLYLLGNTDVAVYDGSWLEWASLDDALIERL